MKLSQKGYHSTSSSNHTSSYLNHRPSRPSYSTTTTLGLIPKSSRAQIPLSSYHSHRFTSQKSNNNNHPHNAAQELPSNPTLNHYISTMGHHSRRRAAELVKQSRVQVNGELMTDPCYRVADTDRVEILGENGRPVVTVQMPDLKSLGVVMLNKPPGYHCKRPTPNDLRQGDGKSIHTIFELFEPRFWTWFYAGRLDAPTEGLLILSNSGKFVNRLAHPSFEVEKEYLVSTVRPLSLDHIHDCLNGIDFDGVLMRAQTIRVIEQSQSRSLYSIVLTQGHKRQIRRMIGYYPHNSVKALKRIRIGSLWLNDLPLGGYRSLSQDEIDKLLINPIIPPSSSTYTAATLRPLQSSEGQPSGGQQSSGGYAHADHDIILRH